MNEPVTRFIRQHAVRIGGAEGRGPSTAATVALLAVIKRRDRR